MTIRLSAGDFADLKLIRNFIRQGPPERYIIDFPTSHYTYADNTWWLFGDQVVEINANGSTFECVSTNAWSRSFSPIAAHQPWETWGDGQFVQTEARHPLGALFKSASKQARYIVLQEPIELAPRDIVLLGGFVQQTRVVDGAIKGSGWPANLRYFEFNRVEGVQENIVLLSKELRFDYDDTWPDLEHTPLLTPLLFGKPRIWRTRVPGYTINRFLRINDAVFVQNRNRLGVTQQIILIGLHVILSSCRAEERISIAPSIGQRYELLNCPFIWHMEIDKIVESVLIDGCTIRQITSDGSGVLDLKIKNTVIQEEIRGIPRNAQFHNLTVNDSRIGFGVSDAKRPFTFTNTVLTQGE